MNEEPKNDIFYEAFTNEVLAITSRLSANDITKESWKIIGKYPIIMDKILEQGKKRYKNNDNIKTFYKENPELLNDVELAKHFLFNETVGSNSYADYSVIEEIFKLFPNSLDYFFKDLKETATWATCRNLKIE